MAGGVHCEGKGYGRVTVHTYQRLLRSTQIAQPVRPTVNLVGYRTSGLRAVYVRLVIPYRVSNATGDEPAPWS